MIWDILLTKLETLDLVQGQNLFLNTMPAEADRAVMLRTALTGVEIDPHIPGFYKPVVQVIVRSNEIVHGQTLANEISKLLTINASEFYAATAERGKARIAVFYPRTLPIQYPRQDGRTTEWSINFTTAFNIHS